MSGAYRTHVCNDKCGHTIDVGYVHVLTHVDGPCRKNCPHPDHRGQYEPRPSSDSSPV